MIRMNSLFEIKDPAPEENANHKCEVWFKNKLLSSALKAPDIIEISDTVQIETLEFLDFDSSLFPDMLHIPVNDSSVHVDYWDGPLFIDRIGNEMKLTYYAGFNHHTEEEDEEDTPHYKMLLNPLQVLDRAVKKAKKYGFSDKDVVYASIYEGYAYPFFYYSKATGNLAAHYRTGLKNLEQLIQDAMDEVKREIAGM
jgi:hypothetical protein